MCGQKAFVDFQLLSVSSYEIIGSFFLAESCRSCLRMLLRLFLSLSYDVIVKFVFIVSYDVIVKFVTMSILVKNKNFVS
jgi:hypothetical protein